MPKKRATGRRVVIEALDAVLARDGNVQTLMDDLQEKFDLNPGEFIKDYALPFTPKEMLSDQEDTDDSAEAKAARIQAALRQMKESTTQGIAAPTITEAQRKAAKNVAPSTATTPATTSTPSVPAVTIVPPATIKVPRKAKQK